MQDSTFRVVPLNLHFVGKTLEHTMDVVKGWEVARCSFVAGAQPNEVFDVCEHSFAVGWTWGGRSLA